MSWDDYWRGPLSAFFIFGNAHKRKMQSEIDLLDYQAWRCGLYTRAAITSTYKMLNPLVQNILGSYDAALGINDNQLSGVAIVEAASQSSATAMPYIVGCLQGFQRAAEVYVSLVPKYFVTPRSLPI